jgi:hypothetical protein
MGLLFRGKGEGRIAVEDYYKNISSSHCIRRLDGYRLTELDITANLKTSTDVDSLIHFLKIARATLTNPRREKMNKWMKENNVSKVGDYVYGKKGVITEMYVNSHQDIFSITISPIQTEFNIGRGVGKAATLRF